MQTFMHAVRWSEPQIESAPVTPSTKTKIHRLPKTPRGLENAVRPQDEFANFLTHFFGFLLSLAGASLMMKLAFERQNTWLIVGCGAYCLSLVCLYAASTLSHAFYDLYRRHFYRQVDQIAIFYLISGSFTPFGVTYLRHGWWPALTISMWALSTLGTIIICRNGFLTAGAQKVYILLGWLPAFSLFTIVHVAPSELVFWTVIGGLFYTAGTLFLFNDHRVRFMHAMWHTFVICGSVCQYIAILQLVVAH